jgi:predicted amidohydrolase
MYTPGTKPVVFEAAGLRFGCALCIEAHFPEIFAEYEQLNVDCMLLSVMVDDPVRPIIAQAYAALYDYWVGYSTPAQYSHSAPAGIVAPGGNWITRCPANGQPAIAVADLDPHADSDIDIAVRLARPWRRTARAGLYESRQAAEDPRSLSRTSF